MPLLSLDTRNRAPYERLPELPSASEDDDSVFDIDEGNGPPAKRKRWWMYLPLLLLVALMFAPQYSILVMLVSYYLDIYKSPFFFITHLSVIYLLTFFAYCSLLVCVVRDPGAIRIGEDSDPQPDAQENEGGDDETDMMDVLRLGPTSSARKGEPEGLADDFNAPHKWCRKCWAPKPERTHHCSACGRCVLKMDHHCPWLAQKCVGHWTYPAFLHFLLCVTLLSTYVAIISGRIVYFAFLNPFLVNERTALHALFLSVYGIVFALVVGSFFLWHVYLASTNQTTIENISPFLLLRYLPSTSTTSASSDTTRPSPLPSAGSVSLDSPNPPRPLSLHPVSQPSTPLNPLSASFPVIDNQNSARNRSSGLGSNAIPMLREHQLSSAQRRAIRHAHGRIRLYDVGFRANWMQLLDVGKRGWRGWAYRILCGGGTAGNGKTFQRNPKADGMLAKLAAELESENKTD